MYYKTKSYKAFSVVNYTFLFALSLLCILPLIHVLAVSLSGSAPAGANLVNFWPIDFTMDAYAKTIDNRFFLRSLIISGERTILGTVLSMFFITLSAYALSKDDRVLKGRSVYTWYFIFTLLFSGGIIPSYILIQNLHMMNTIWALVLPGVVNVWNLILLMNFFRTIPKELEEAALIDGAGHFKTLLTVFIPLSTPAIATLTLFTMVSHWNSWFDGMIYISRADNYPLATFLQTIIVQQDFTKMNFDPKNLQDISNRTVKAAQIFIGAMPILLVYPFLQRYFVKGIVLGAVKE
ncbi:carbohydrate ABC transporter permease [Paenibacillus solisilvae]|uniref:Carbohydrate ABC transporter permease n=1 Tax=Paenibacillus solisilvae TaxID=2486751 RepID=A0ABW0VS83_9BACL